jgi:1-deoxy-D-xylulose 5-phosphate reductoisomerase
MSKKRILLLGSTGSIGTQTLDVISRHSEISTFRFTCARKSHGCRAPSQILQSYLPFLPLPPASPKAELACP